MSRNNTEYCTLIEATGQLTRAVKNDLVQLSVELVANQLITVDKGEELRNRNVDVMERAAELVALVTNKVEQDKKNYYTFVRILMDHKLTYEEVLKVLEPVFTSGDHFYNKGASGALTIDQPWFHGKLSRQDAEKRLRKMDGDSFLVRESANQPGRLILSVKNRRTFYHFGLDRGVGTYEVEGTNLPFSSPVELIDYYTKYGLPENDSGEVILLKLPCNITLHSSANNCSNMPTQLKNDSYRHDQGSSKLSRDKAQASCYESAEIWLKPVALLNQQKYFHGSISRRECEALLDKDGQFLVRESSKQPGQFVLTGMVDGQPCHLLLTDEKGKIVFKDKSDDKDIKFENILHLVTHLIEKETLVFHESGSKMILKEPVSVVSDVDS